MVSNPGININLPSDWGGSFLDSPHDQTRSSFKGIECERDGKTSESVDLSPETRLTLQDQAAIEAPKWLQTTPNWRCFDLQHCRALAHTGTTLGT